MKRLSTVDGRTLRDDCLDEPVTAEREVAVGKHDAMTVNDVVSRDALKWVDAVATLLEKHESYREKKLKMSKGSTRRGDYESFLVDMDMSFSQSANSRQYAELQGLERQLMGGDLPDGTKVDGVYDEPMTLLFSLTTSSTADGDFRPPVDHDREIRDAWTGSTDSVKRVLRDVLRRKCGLEPSDYAWHYQSEPHPGDGDAAGYAHAHPMVVLDAAAATGDADPTDPETFRPVVAKHVSKCEHAEWTAHNLDVALSVNEPGEIDDLASYVSKYVAIGPDKDLLERSPEYLLYAGAQFAASTQKYSRSKWATAAINADQCKQQYRSDQSNQLYDHGEKVVRSARQHVEYECSCCGSPHDIEQSGTLVSHRLEEPATAQPAATDGGTDARESLEDRWPTARSAGKVGSATQKRQCQHDAGSNQCPLCAESEGAVPPHVPIPETATVPTKIESTSGGFDREPRWGPESIVQLDEDEEESIGAPGGVDYGQVQLEGARSITGQLPVDHLPPADVLEGPEPWSCPDAPSWVTETAVRSGELPPPELLHREQSELVVPNSHITRKQWSDNWYDEQYGTVQSEPDALTNHQRDRVRELVRLEGTTSTPAVLGKLGLSPELADAVNELTG
jgi:hypothetical protein